ncbi:MAG: GIY-YIG nuclease family protein [Candidatus Methanoperedens sp.]
MKGIYALILRLNNDIDLTIGKLGKFHFKTGYYYYIGSALGMGGFKRVTRHFNVASGKNKTRKWHIDHLLPQSEVICALLLPTGEALECKAAQTLMDFSQFIPGFGCSDCTCRSHLFFHELDIKNDIISIANKLTGNESIIIYPGM